MIHQFHRSTLATLIASSAALILALAFSGCGSESADDGRLLISVPTGIVSYEISSQVEAPLLTPATANTFLFDPAVSPDGERIAYITQPPPRVKDNLYDSGSDLWVAASDGTGARVVFEHVEPNQLVRYPQWLDATHILAIVQEIIAAEGRTRVVYTLQRFDLESGTRDRLREDVLTFALSPDRSRLAFAQYEEAAGQSLMVGDADGANATQLVGTDARLAPFASLRFSPDGESVAFAAAEIPSLRSSERYVAREAAAPPLRPNADGLPQDIWSVPASGGNVTRLADLKEDSPALDWNGEGEHVYAIGINGLYDINLTSGAVTRLRDGAFHAQLVWLP